MGQASIKPQFGVFLSSNQANMIDSLNVILDQKIGEKEFYDSHYPSDLRAFIQKRPEDACVIVRYLYNQIRDGLLQI